MEILSGLPFEILEPVQLISLSVRVIVEYAIAFFPNTSSWRKWTASCCEVSSEYQLNVMLGVNPGK
jgi:hypothetical protein